MHIRHSQRFDQNEDSDNDLRSAFRLTGKAISEATPRKATGEKLDVGAIPGTKRRRGGAGRRLRRWQKLGD